MKSLFLLVCISASVAACASSPAPEGSALTDGTTAYTLACEPGWSQCYAQARKICGGDFDELDRATDTSVSAAGRLDRMHSVEGGIENHVYSENPREEVYSRVLTIRCRTAR